MNKLDEIKQIYREYVKQFEYLTKSIYSLPACRQFTEVSSFYRRIEKKTDLLKNMAERGLDQIHAITPPTVERITRYKNMLKFLNAFYVLWCESFIIQYDGYLCVPPYTADPHENYPFLLHSVEDDDFEKKAAEMINNPSGIDLEIKRFRDRLRAGFRTYGEENVKKCEDRLELFRRRLPIKT